MSTMPASPWSTTQSMDDDNDWDSADGGFSTKFRKKQQKQNGQMMMQKPSPSMEAETWLSTGRHFSPVAVIVTPPTSVINVTHRKQQRKHAAVTVESSTPESDAIPMSYVNTIISAFGPDADLYHDVLDIPRHCSLRETRIAYFRRGRQVLAEHSMIPQPYQTAASVGGNVSAMAKLRFQAVSMAYEILTNDKWKNAYHTHGLQPEYVSVNVIHVTPTTTTTTPPTTPLLRRSSSMDSTRRKSHHAVRWNEEVEELVFNQHPSELSKRVDDNTNEEDGNSSRKKKKGRKKKRAVIETEELRSHLEHLDREAERDFVSDFLDDLESSFDDLLSLGSKKSISHDLEAEEGNDNDNYKDDNDEKERTPNTRILQSNSANKKKQATPGTIRAHRATETDHPKQPIPSQRSEPPRQGRNKLERKESNNVQVVPANDNHVKQLTYDFPEIFIDQKTTRRVKDDGNSTVATSDSVSTLSASIVDKRVAMNTSRGASRPYNLDRLSEIDDDFNTTNVPISPNPSPQKLSNKHDNQSVATAEDDFDDSCDAVQAVESWCGPDDMDDLTTIKDSVNKKFKNREPRDETVSTSTGGTTPMKDESQEEDTYAQYRHFHIHLMTYLNSLTVDLGAWGTAIVPTSLMEAIMLSEEDLDGMIDILRTEMDLIPDDFDALEEIEEIM